MSDLGDITVEELEALRAERDRLKSERDSERMRAEAESRRADELHNTVVSSSKQIAESQIAGLTAQEAQAEQTIQTLTGEIATLKRQWADLQAEGKFEEAADVQEKIGDATARRAQANQAKTYYANQREQARAQPTDPVDRFLANGQYNDAEREWIKRNPRYATDRGFQERVNGAHAEAVRAGAQPGTPEYFQRLEAAGYMRQLPEAPKPAQTGMGRSDPPERDPSDDPDADPYSEAHLEDPPVQPQPARQPVRPVAAAPSRRSPAAPARPAAGGRQLTPEESATALALSEYFPPEVLEQGEAGIYAHYAQLKSSPMAKRLRENWPTGA